MTREFLKELGITEETTEKIMAEHGKSLTAEQQKTAQKEKEMGLVQKNLDEANAVIQSYKDMKLDDIKKSAAEWETKAKALEAEKTEMSNQFLLEKALMGADAHDAELLEKAIDKTALKFEGGKIKGLDSQLKELKESKPFLFKPADASKDPTADSRFQSHSPAGSSGAGAGTAQSVLDSIFGDANNK